MKVNAKKTKVLVCSKKGDEKVNCFKYLGSLVSDGGECEKYIILIKGECQLVEMERV